MQTVNIHHAKTHLSRLVDEVAEGREIVIARAGRPVARLVPLEDRPRPKRFGLLAGRFRVPDDINEPLPEAVLELFGAGRR